MSYLKFNNVTLWNADGSTPGYVLAAETDVNGRTHVIESVGDRAMNVYRDTKAENRSYTVVVKVYGSSPSDYAGLKADWEAWHSAFLGECVVERETVSGAVLQLSAVAEAPQWSDEGPNWGTVTQVYTAAFPWWRTAEESAADNFDGATPVSLVCDNDGDIPTWVRVVVEGSVDTPKVELAGEWELEFNLLVDVGEELEIITQTPAKVWHSVSGVPAKAYGYRTSETSFRKAKLAVGSNTLTLTCSSGTGLCTVYWTPLFEGLF